MKYRYIDTYGYIRIKVWSHPYHDKQGYVCEHRLVVEEKLKRYLLPTEVVHHKNGNKQNNRIENLEVLSTSEHRTKHNLENNPFIGRKHSLETKQRMSEIAKKNGNGKWNIGRPRSAETIRKILETKRLKKIQNQHL